MEFALWPILNPRFGPTSSCKLSTKLPHLAVVVYQALIQLKEHTTMTGQLKDTRFTERTEDTTASADLMDSSFLKILLAAI